MLSLAFIARDCSPEAGGTHVYNLEFARRLAARGHQVRLFTWMRPETRSPDPGLPFEVRRAPLVRAPGGIDPGDLVEVLRRWRPHVALVSGSAAAMARTVRVAARQVPVAVSVHDLRDKGRRGGRIRCWRARRRYGYDRAVRILANSEYTRGCLLRLGIAREKVRVVHPGVDTAHFAPDPGMRARLRAELGLGRRPVLLTVARLAPNKGHARVIGVLPRLRARISGLLYLIVGDGELRPELERQAEALGVADAVRFTGRVPDVRPYYNACDVFVMASTPHGRGLKAGEGFGIAYLEAAACARPAVASSSGGGPEIVAQGITGRVVDPDDDAGLAESLAELLADPELARGLGEKARARALEYDWDRCVRTLEEVLQEAARAR